MPASVDEYGEGQQAEKKPSAVPHRLVEINGIALFAAVTLVLGTWLLQQVDPSNLGHVTLLVTALLAGWIISDFTSGFVHFLGDRFGTVDMPVLGEAFIKPFREHHVDPKDITRHDFVETNGNNCLIVIVLLFVPMFLLYVFDGHSALALWLEGVLWMLGFATFLTNQIHSWAHADSIPPVVRALQRSRLILSPEHHDIHHRAPYDTHYCITSGWLNPIFAYTRFFERFEKMVRYVIGK